MTKAEFQKIHDEMKALKAAGKQDEFAKKFVTKDAIFMGPLHEPANVNEAAKFAKSEMMAAVSKGEFNITIDEITPIGDVVIERCTIHAKVASGDKTGWSLCVWVKDGGAWKIRNSCTTFKVVPSA
ncbi:DUF4440 domain-containing protein [Caenorhabditis elegans]|uniref:DUF4440 domain-containing protein n=1 Tax=Caenorhabditis elegans TaxID=6239 RepID=Q21887_CAEEL|nr:DUF4440 domain-containing protein [Caenorhabditis elegans]CAA94355.2 DUF4440 domain-containing protein [Caenorhabditis elegans]|eukprot:NP_501974.2 Uncharacterized protein CELE_R102.1 [Caenorhabditis elegans]